MLALTVICGLLAWHWLGRQEAPGREGLRWQLLCALRGLARGAAFVVQADPKTKTKRVVIFEGQRFPHVVGAILLAREWVCPVRPHWMPDSSFYGLSPLGAEALAEGWRWWRSLPLHRRLLLRLTE